MASFERVRHVRRGVSFDAALRTLAIANLRVSLFDFDGAVTGLPAQPMRLEQDSSPGCTADARFA